MVTKPRTPEPSPYEQLLNALGDSDQARLLINQFAHSLAVTVKQVEESQYPGPASAVIDPFQHTRETWAAVTRCGAIATPLPEGTAP